MISKLLKARYSLTEIARTIGKSKSALGRHVTNHGGRDNYSIQEVRRSKRIRRVAAMVSIRVLKGQLLRFVIKELKQHKSPEQIAGVLQKQHQVLAPSTIYRYINERAPHLKQYLRSQKGKYRRRRGTKIREQSRESTKKRRIDERPRVIELRSRLGDFEGDTMLGRDKRVRIVTIVDRKSGYLIAFLLPKMRAELLSELAIKRLQRISKHKRHTLTLDNGVEFSDWERLEKRTNMTVYFAYPYHAWERGTNENTNGLLRQYFPKSHDFNLITPSELTQVVKRINQRERKRLDFESPYFVFNSCN